jgi:hypothetical protein
MLLGCSSISTASLMFQSKYQDLVLCNFWCFALPLVLLHCSLNSPPYLPSKELTTLTQDAVYAWVILLWAKVTGDLRW